MNYYFFCQHAPMVRNQTKLIFEKYKQAIRQSDIVKAGKHLEQLKAIAPAKGWYHQGLFWPFVSKKNNTWVVHKQINAFKRSLRFNTKNAAAWRALGNSLFRLKKYTEAERAYKKSFEYSKSRLYKNDALRFLADIALQQGKKTNALQLLKRVLKSKYRPPYIQLAPHFIAYYQKTNNQKRVNYWANKGLVSTKIIAKSGKQAYGPPDTYKKIEQYFQNFIR